jgi:monomeric sarcosine oxidase
VTSADYRMPIYDAIVVGTGGVGSAALFHLAARGAKVLGLDRFPPGHDRGSSHGQTRIIRLAYFEHPDYVPLLQRAYELWHELERLRGRPLYHEIGLVQVGPAEGAVVKGVRRSAQQHALDVEEFDPRELSARFPGFRAAENSSAIFERRAGYLDVEACVVAHVEEAQRLGAELLTGLTVHGWRDAGELLAVDTDQGEFLARRLVLAPGAWASQVLGTLPLRLVVRRKPQYWYPAGADYQADHGCSAFLFETSAGIFYGLPQIDARGLKAAEHTGGNEVGDPLNIDRRSDRAEATRVESFLADHLPGVSRPSSQYSVCMYTLTPDEHFVVDRHPADPRVVLAAGLSGHGFKFTCVLGEALAELTLDGQTRLPIDFLALDRPGLQK